MPGQIVKPEMPGQSDRPEMLDQIARSEMLLPRKSVIVYTATQQLPAQY